MDTVKSIQKPLTMTTKYKGAEYEYNTVSHVITQKNNDIVKLQPPVAKTKKYQSKSLHIWLSLTDSCNLGCSYCFSAENMTKAKTPLGLDNAKNIIATLAKQWSGKDKIVKLVFFGGEPLIRFNDLEKIVYFAQSIGKFYDTKFDFQIATNGVLITERMANFFARENIAVQISIDGDKATHDFLRPYLGGKGSYDKTIKGARLLLEKPSIRVNARATLSRVSLSIFNIIKSIAEVGFKIIYIEAVARNNASDVGIDDAAMKTLKKEMEMTAEYIADLLVSGVKVFPFLEHIESLDTYQVRSFVCGAGTSAFSYDINGDMYPCHRFHGNKEYKISDFKDNVGIITNEKFKNLKTSYLPECSKCWARKFCWGCCPGESEAFDKNLGEPTEAWCSYKRLQSELSIMTAIAYSKIINNQTIKH